MKAEVMSGSVSLVCKDKEILVISVSAWEVIKAAVFVFGSKEEVYLTIFDELNIDRDTVGLLKAIIESNGSYSAALDNWISGFKHNTDGGLCDLKLLSRASRLLGGIGVVDNRISDLYKRVQMHMYALQEITLPSNDHASLYEWRTLFFCCGVMLDMQRMIDGCQKDGFLFSAQTVASSQGLGTPPVALLHFRRPKRRVYAGQ